MKYNFYKFLKAIHKGKSAQRVQKRLQVAAYVGGQSSSEISLSLL